MKKISFLENPSDYVNDFAFVAHLSKTINNKNNLLEEIKIKLKTPDYFGFNWDALNDCLNDFHWIKEKKIIFVHDRIPNLDDSEMNIYLGILIEALKSWGEEEEHYFELIFPKEDEKKIKHYLQNLDS